MSFRLLSILFLSIFVLVGCSTISPDSPAIQTKAVNVPTQPTSSIEIPVKINLKPYFEETDKSIPTKFKGKEQVCEGVSYSYKFFRGPIKFEGKGTSLLFDIEGRYSLKLNYCPTCTGLFDSKGTCIVPRIYSSCGVNEPLRKIEVGYATKIGLTKDYKLSSLTKLRRIKTVTPCLVSVFNYDATSTLKEEITIALQELEKDIDEEISTVDLRPEMEETWNTLSEPIDLEGYGFLNINPRSVSISKIRFKGDTAYFNTIIEATPTILSSKSLNAPSLLPNLSTYQKRDGFDITMDIFTTYDSLSSIISKNIQGTSTEVKGKTIIFEEVEVHGAANNAIHLKVKFSGDKRGILYFTGTPTFNSATQEIAFPDMVFDLKTKDALLKSAKWMFNDKITKMVREASAMDLKPYLDSLKTSINENLNTELSKGVFMSGKVIDLSIDYIHPMENQLFLRVKSAGKLEISM